MNQIADRVRGARASRRISQDAVARLRGPSRPTLSKIERGLRVQSVERQVKLLGGILKVNWKWLLGLPGELEAMPVSKEDGAAEEAIPYQARPLLAQVIAQSRARSGLTTDQIAERLRLLSGPENSIDGATLERIESGAETPTEAVLGGLAAILGFSLRELASAFYPPPPPAPVPDPADARLDDRALVAAIQVVEKALARANRAFTLKQRAELYVRFYEEFLLRGEGAKKDIQGLLDLLLKRD